MDWTNLQKNLEARGFSVRIFDTEEAAADYLAGAIQGKTVGFGGSMTLDRLGLYERLSADNQCFWHWKTPGPETVASAAAADGNVRPACGEWRKCARGGRRHISRLRFAAGAW